MTKECRHEFVPLTNTLSGLTNIERCRNCDERRIRQSTEPTKENQ